MKKKIEESVFDFAVHFVPMTRLTIHDFLPRDFWEKENAHANEKSRNHHHPKETSVS
jgi:hypothetical protein